MKQENQNEGTEHQDDLHWAVSVATSSARSPASLAWRVLKRRACRGSNSPSTFDSKFISSTTAPSSSLTLAIFPALKEVIDEEGRSSDQL